MIRRILEEEENHVFKLLRLRFRFPINDLIGLNEKFRLVIDLVDEMAQPFKKLQQDLKLHVHLVHQAEVVEDSVIQLKHDKGAVYLLPKETGKAIIDLKIERTKDSIKDKGQSIPIQLIVKVAADSMHQEPQKVVEEDSFHEKLQRFCINSHWMSNDLLILPVLISTTLVIGPSPRYHSPPVPVPTSKIYRIFEGFDQKPLYIEEKYGDTMGSHIWDASIIMSYFLVHCGLCPPKSTKILEIASGCGLLANVLASNTCGHQLVLTEKPDSISLLESNLTRNARQSEVMNQVEPLLWGNQIHMNQVLTHEFDLIVACDVLYNWKETHELLLNTLWTLIQKKKYVQILLAHCHRTSQSRQMVQDVLTKDPTTHSFSWCPLDQLNSSSTSTTNTSQHDGCAWTKWTLQRLTSRGHVDLLQLTPLYI